MNNRLTKGVSPFNLLALLAVLSGCASQAPVEAKLEAVAKAITHQYVSTLLPTLQQAMAEGGPVKAVEVCSASALSIADELGQETGWSVRRVSLKTRNGEHATPDSWEREALVKFDLMRANGASAAELTISETVAGEFRFMQGQITQPLCLTCHGSGISPEVRSALDQHYPDDLATGYRAGDVRGAISLGFKPN